ncbi:hypothetical protein AG4045_001415 [Apium graveolens]|uniref:HHO5-like N-terminal domain-containing protein n=1 Tax=Apium graveolens TaxID=4045 RepID=A0A6L5BFF4_APIGR|nr:hypothetical protein AG4045_001415 [Apium graveolens]
MMSFRSELTFHCKPHDSSSMLLKSYGGDQQTTVTTDQAQKLEDLLSCLEEECHKIDAFKRELPLGLQLLDNGIPDILLLPFYTKQPTIPSASPEETQSIGFVGSRKPGNGADFLPFSKERNSRPCTIGALPELALVSVDKETEDKKWTERIDNKISNCSRGENPALTAEMTIERGKRVIFEYPQTISTNTGVTSTTSLQTRRKARRCWSPDLHRRFVNALQMLGGSQGKEIRTCITLSWPICSSEGDKYRIHTKRPSPSLQSAHQGCIKSQHYQVPQEYYSAIAPQAQGHHQLHNHTLHHQLHMYKQPSSQTYSSAESDMRGNTTNQSEYIEGGKSESCSWKAGSEGTTENGRDKKALMPKEERGESNESDITLKF